VTIRFYPSRLPGEPLETHEHRDTTLHDWMLQHVDNYRNEMVQRVALRLMVTGPTGRMAFMLYQR
jgi:hypothetical protein